MGESCETCRAHHKEPAAHLPTPAATLRVRGYSWWSGVIDETNPRSTYGPLLLLFTWMGREKEASEREEKHGPFCSHLSSVTAAAGRRPQRVFLVVGQGQPDLPSFGTGGGRDGRGEGRGMWEKWTSE